MKFAKGILSVGTHKAPRGDVVVTPERLKHWAEQHRAMLKAGIGIPVSYDHADEAAGLLPVSLSSLKDAKQRSAANAVGWLDSINPNSDGSGARVVLDIPDSTAAKKAEQNVVELSPVITKEYRDGSGTVWNDVITHFDLVVHPVDHTQTPFKPVGENNIACSIRMSLDGKLETFRMSNEEGEQDPSESNEPPAEENPDMPKVGQSDDQKQFEAIKAYLQEVGIDLPADSDDSTFKRDLLTALKTWKLTKDKAAAEEAAKNAPEEDDEMSFDEKSPQFAAMSLKANSAHTYAENLHKQGVSARLEKLLTSGRCTAAEVEAQKPSLGSIKLSLTDEGKPETSKLELWIESREALPAGACWDPESRIQRMGLEEVGAPTPEQLNGDISDAEAEELADEVCKPKRKRKSLPSEAVNS